MSTSYYRLKPPITSVRAEVSDGHTHLGIWINHAKSGTLVVRNEELQDLLRVLTDDGSAVVKTRFGGSVLGKLLEPLDREWTNQAADYTTLVSECGELTTLGELRRGLGGSRSCT